MRLKKVMGNAGAKVKLLDRVSIYKSPHNMSSALEDDLDRVEAENAAVKTANSLTRETWIHALSQWMAKGTQELQTSYDQNWRVFAQGDDALNEWGEKLSHSISMQVTDLEMILRPALDMVKNGQLSVLALSTVG